jgi:hypothetical protein
VEIGRPAFVDRAIVTAQKHAAVFVGALQNHLPVVAHHRVVRQEFLPRGSQQLHEVRDVALCRFDFRDLATLRARTAVDGIVNFLGGLVKLALDVVVRREPLTEAHVLGVLLFAFAFDLDQIGEQVLA